MPITTAKTPKVYVAVRAEFTEDGTMLPREITWEDGEIDIAPEYLYKNSYKYNYPE